MTCLVIIDVQRALVEEGPHDRDAFLGGLEALLARARKAGTPVVHVQHEDEELRPGTPGWEIWPTLSPLPGEPVFAKQVSSAFRDTALEAWLRDRGIDTLVVAGMQTEFCMDASIKSAFERHFRVFVPEGGHSTFDGLTLPADQIKAWYGRIWNHRFADLVPLDRALDLVGA